MGLVSPTIPFFLKAAASTQQVLNVIEKKDQEEDSAALTTTLEKETFIGNITLKDVAFYYPSRPTITVLDSLNLEIPANKTTAVVGPSGSGKSTIISLIERWYSPSRGSIKLDGLDIGNISLSKLRGQISLVQQVRLISVDKILDSKFHQDPMLFNDTILQNVLNGYHGGQVDDLSEKQKQLLVTNACLAANVHEFMDHLPDGYNTVVGERSSLLSGG